LPGPAGALLLEGLGAAARHLRPGFGALGTQPGGRQLGGDDLVHHRHAGVHTEGGLVELDGAHDGAVDRSERDAGHVYLASGDFTALRTITTPPRGPGMAPFTSSRSRSTSAETTSRLRV